ncbi:MAG: nucleotidyl transferase AbiEii/AbiGii toxin family protein [Steroidobacteraceae bacterium]
MEAVRITRHVRLSIFSEAIPPIPLKLKIETNTREHFAVHGLKELPFAVDSRWFAGDCNIQSYTLDELLATKLRALYQRKQGRDLFDLATALKCPGVDPNRIVEAFSRYMKHEGQKISRAQFEENFTLKLKDAEFMADISPLLAAGHEWVPKIEAAVVQSKLIELLPGESWKGAT